jgi:hypothetical protein
MGVTLIRKGLATRQQAVAGAAELFRGRGAQGPRPAMAALAGAAGPQDGAAGPEDGSAGLEGGGA